MKKKLIITCLLISCVAVAYICAQPGPPPHRRPGPPPRSPLLLTPKHAPAPPMHHHHHPPRRPLPPPRSRVYIHISRPVTVYKSSRSTYRDPPPVRRDLPISKVEYEYVYDVDYECSVQGMVKAIDPDAGTLVIDTDGDTLIVAASASTKVFKDNDDPNNNSRVRGVISIGLGDIHKGDFVGVQVSDTGDVTLSASIVHVFDLTR